MKTQDEIIALAIDCGAELKTYSKGNSRGTYDVYELTAEELQAFFAAALTAAQPAAQSFAQLYEDHAQGIEIERLKMRIEDLEAAQPAALPVPAVPQPPTQSAQPDRHAAMMEHGHSIFITQPAPAAPYQVTDEDVDLFAKGFLGDEGFEWLSPLRNCLEAHEARKAAQQTAMPAFDVEAAVYALFKAADQWAHADAITAEQLKNRIRTELLAAHADGAQSQQSVDAVAAARGVK